MCGLDSRPSVTTAPRIDAARHPEAAPALRTSRKHLLEARQQMGQAYSSAPDRLERYEQHLSARLEALKSARTAFAKLHGSLDETQKRTADELVAPFIATF